MMNLRTTLLISIQRSYQNFTTQIYTINHIILQKSINIYKQQINKISNF